MKKLSPITYRSLFLKHVYHFLQSVTKARELSGNHAVAVSAGLDSMTLLWVAQELHKQGKIGPVRAFFVNHQTRIGQTQDAALVKKYCAEMGVPLVMLTVEGLGSHNSNFEARARKARRDLCLGALGTRELLWVGHHLDDSFEWNFMQRHRSTNLKSTIGIPVRNRRIVRPFLSVTRAQLKRLAVFEGIPFRNDPTNLDLRFDRNYVRHQIVPLIKKRYPKYLKFYAQLANFSAMILNTSLLLRSGAARLYAYEEGALLVGKHFSEIQIQELIHSYSNTDRGEIVTTIHRMLKAIDNGKKGPFHFSGGSEAIHAYGVLMIYRKGFRNYDQSIADVLTAFPLDGLRQMTAYSRDELEQAWQNLLRSPDALKNLPGLVLVMESESLCKTLNTSVFDPSFPLVSAVCKEKGLRFMTFQKVLDVWIQKKERLPKKLRLVPLYNLSNLYPS